MKHHLKAILSRRVFLALVALVSLVLLIATSKDFIQDVFRPYVTSLYCSVAKASRNESQGLKQVLIYTPKFGELPWPGELSTEPCSHKCLFTYNKCELPTSDAVLFHERDMMSSKALKRIAVYLRRNSLQRWVYYTLENPHNTRNNPATYNGMFNWTITYRRDSDIFMPYGNYREIHSKSEIPKEHFTTNYAKGKDKLIAWAVSHCKLLRDEVVQSFLKYLPVTIIGKCSKRFNQVSPKVCARGGSGNCEAYLKTFKFYLSFENGQCLDYITEKYWRTPLNNNMIPIVLGSDYDTELVIPGSYINVLDFTSMKALSNYINYLDKNDTAYNEYFKWKTKYTERFDMPEKEWTCQLCRNLYNQSLPRKVYNNLGAFWGVESSCNRHEWRVNRLLA